MLVLRQSLQNCGYCGVCEDEQILAWAVRTGACSEFFKDLLTWLEQQLSGARFTHLVRGNIRNLFALMRSSVLMKPHVDAPETVLNPKEYRLQTLKVLVHQLELARRMELNEKAKVLESPKTHHQQRGEFNTHSDLRVTLNVEKKMSSYGDRVWNERLVRYSPSLLKMYE